MIKLNEEQKKLLKLEDKRIDYYFKVENAVIDNSETFDNIYASHLFIVLSRYCNNNNVAFPSYATLAKLCYCSRSTIIKAMNTLEKKGLINKLIRNKKIKDKTLYESNLYTINNINKYSIITEDKKDNSVIDKDSSSKISGVVSEKDHSSSYDTLYKEQVINNKLIKNNTITSNKKDRKNSSRYEFLNLSKYFLLNQATAKNINNNIADLTEERFIEVYNLTVEYINQNKDSNFNAILYRALNNEWNFDVLNKEKIRKTELDSEKKRWLQYFGGIICDKELKEEIERIIVDISLETLNKNKSKLSKMNLYEFKQHLYSLKKISE